jgi:hypothetical protein
MDRANVNAKVDFKDLRRFACLVDKTKEWINKLENAFASRIFTKMRKRIHALLVHRVNCTTMSLKNAFV